MSGRSCIFTSLQTLWGLYIVVQPYTRSIMTFWSRYGALQQASNNLVSVHVFSLRVKFCSIVLQHLVCTSDRSKTFQSTCRWFYQFPICRCKCGFCTSLLLKIILVRIYFSLFHLHRFSCLFTLCFRPSFFILFFVTSASPPVGMGRFELTLLIRWRAVDRAVVITCMIVPTSQHFHL